MAQTDSTMDRDRLVANGLAHKIRNSLNTMRAHVALAQKFAASSTAARLPRQINKLEDVIVGLEETVEEFLAFASPAKDEWEEVDLAALVREVLDFVALDLEQGNVRLVSEFAARLPRAFVDRGKLKRALLNLVLNARQAMPEGGHLTVRVQLAKGGHLCLQVSDTGCGIPEDEAGRIFQPFFSTKPGGLGLGLAIVKRTVDDFRGRITFESKVGVGTTFSILLPTASRRRAALERQARRQQWLQPAGSPESTPR